MKSKSAKPRRLRGQARRPPDRAPPVPPEGRAEEVLGGRAHAVQGWYPLGHGDSALLQEPVFAELGKKYGKSSAQVILRWHVQSGFVTIPGSKNPAHIRDNFDLFDFALTDEETGRIAALDKGARYFTCTPELLEKFAAFVPDVDGQK